MASNGLRTFSYASIYGHQELEGFIVVKVQGLLHVQTDYGVYEVDSDFVETHNCVMMNKVCQQSNYTNKKT